MASIQNEVELSEHKEGDLCIDCGKDGISNCYSDMGRSVFLITGLCEKCFESTE